MYIEIICVSLNYRSLIYIAIVNILRRRYGDISTIKRLEYIYLRIVVDKYGQTLPPIIKKGPL